MSSIQIGSRSFTLPKSRIARILIGVLLIIGGIMGFLPILGFWMVPLGVLVLSYDLHLVRRARRRFEVWLARRRNGTNGNGKRANGRGAEDKPSSV